MDTEFLRNISVTLVMLRDTINTLHMQWSVLFRKNDVYFGIKIILSIMKC